ncbi:MAG: hypothetical protein JWR84_1003 [Caulobacter sp.]|nr:hypothetical protein [Caulobacter sp.]
MTADYRATGDEAQRMAAVRRYDILDTPPDGNFDRITALAARRFGTPISIISVVDHDRIWFKSRHGVDVAEIGRDNGLCASAILSPDTRVLEDARRDPHAFANPLVAGSFGLRFYAGAPLRTSDGYNLGTLCVIDHEPRVFTQQDIDDLEDLAALVVDNLELRLAARHAVSRAEMLAREIDHRVMNSLQFVSGILTMQSRAAGPGEIADQLEIASGRVTTVARVHRHFHTQVEGGSTDALGYLRRLCEDLAEVLRHPIAVEGDADAIPADQMQPLGLITNELVTNAAKHGGGEITVAYRVEDGARVLSVCDRGAGLPAGFDPAASRTGLGMRVIDSLVRQLGGRLAAGAAPGGVGACFTVRFPTGGVVVH